MMAANNSQFDLIDIAQGSILVFLTEMSARGCY